MENKMFRLKRLHSQIRRLFPVLFLVLALIMMVLWRTQNPVIAEMRFKTAQFFAPAVSVFSAPANWIKAIKDEFSNLVFLYHRNQILEEENKNLRAWRALALQYQAEHNDIKKMIKYVPYPKSTTVVARLIMDTGGKFSRSYIALAGSESGLKNGAVALTDRGLFARVIEVGPHAARLMLLTDYLSRVPVLVGQNRIPAILTGDNSKQPKLIFTENAEKIQEGDVVLTSGYMGVYPSGLNVGIVASVQEDKISVELFESGEQLTFVRLVDFGLGGNLLQDDCEDP